MKDTKPKNNRAILKLLPVFFLILSIALAAFRTVLLFTDIDTATGLYTDTRLGSIFTGLALALFAACLITGFAAKKFEYTRPIKNESVAAALAASICALMMVAILFADIYDIFVGKRALNLLLGADMILCIPTIVYFFYICSKGAKIDPNDPPTYNLLPLFPALYAAVRTVTLFIDKETQINASQRSFVLLTMICIMMFFVTEAEFAVPKLQGLEEDAEKKAMRRISAKYYALGLAVSCLVLVIILSYAIVQAFWLYKDDSILYNIMDICFGLYAIIRVFSI